MFEPTKVAHIFGGGAPMAHCEDDPFGNEISPDLSMLCVWTHGNAATGMPREFLK
ncbi:MAG: hypothetical protein IPF53_03740 [Blastocatellia bacterium]|nr:hypothetical protein [Blastocatellia bacterium]MBK6428364.1 hypothetical protein [Blastocatellia bacterium]